MAEQKRVGLQRIDNNFVRRLLLILIFTALIPVFIFSASTIILNESFSALKAAWNWLDIREKVKGQFSSYVRGFISSWKTSYTPPEKYRFKDKR